MLAKLSESYVNTEYSIVCTFMYVGRSLVVRNDDN